ncbi:MAG: hypothetical protein LM566_02955 [Pyrobaculum sp.]|nr:hypothetical protein [Pyrobaculum sp.]
MIILLLTTLIIFAYKNIDAVSVEPRYVNAYTYTNLTIKDAEKVQGVEGAVVDFNITQSGVIYLGLKPLRQNGTVTLTVDGKTYRLQILPICRIEITVSNMTSRIEVNATTKILNTTETCRDVYLYVNGTKVGGPRVSYIPQYSGIYQITASTGVFYDKKRIVVVPNVTVSNNVYGEIMQIRLIPPPKNAVVTLGPLPLPVKDGIVEVDTWGLGAGNYTLRLYMSGVVQVYPIYVARATPTLVVLHKAEYIYGEGINATVRVFVGRREYRATVQISVNQTYPAVVRAPSALVFPMLDVGTYQITASVLGDRNVTSVTSVSVFRVLPAPVRLDVKINGTFSNPYIVEYGKVLSLSASASSLTEPQGRIVIYLDGRPAAPLLDTLKIGAGSHNLTVVFTPASRNFLPAKASTVIYVTPSVPDIRVNKTFSITYGEELVVPIYVTLYGRPINATAVVELTGRSRVFNYTLPIINGVGILKTRDLSAGTYLGTVSIVETQNILGAKTVFNVFVSSAFVKLILDVPTRGVYGELLPIKVAQEPRGVPGRLYIIINGTVVYAGNSSVYNGWWSPPRGGVFQVVARFESLDPNYASTDNITYIYVDRARCVVRFTLRGDVEPNDTVYVLRRYEVRPLSTLPVQVFVNGTRAGFIITFNKTGIYNVTVFFPGDDSYYPCGASQNYAAVKNPVAVSISASRRVALIDGGLPLVVTLKSPVGREEGEAVVYKINKTFNKTEIQRLVLNKTTKTTLVFSDTGVYEIYVKFLGNDFLLSNRSNVVTVTVESSYFGVPTFLLAVYLVPMTLGFAAAYVFRRIFRKRL